MLFGHQPEVDSYSITSAFCDNPEIQQWREIFTVGRTSGSIHAHTFCLEWEIARCAIFHWLMGSSLDGQGLGKAWLGNRWERERHLEKHTGRSLQVGKELEVTCVPCTCSSKGDSPEEEFSNQIDKMTQSVDRQLLSPAIPLIAQWTHKHDNRDCHSPSLTWLSSLLSARSSSSRD